MPAVTMNNVQFYRPPNLLNPHKPQNPSLATIPTPPNPPAQRPFPTADISSSLSHPSQQLGHSFPRRLSPSAPSPIFHASQHSQSPDNPQNDFDRILEQISSDDGTQPLDRSRRNITNHAAVPCRSDLRDSSSGCRDIPVKADIAAESVPEFGLHTCQAGESRDDSMVISHDDEQRGESADTPTYPSMLFVRETSTNRGGELDGMARVSRASLALREVSETPLITADEVTTSAGPHTGVSPRPRSRPLIPVDHVGAARKRWRVKKVLDSRIRMRGGKATLEYRVAWMPTWQPRSDMIPGCEELVKEFHMEWKDKRPSPTALAGHRHFSQKTGSRRGGGRGIAKSIG
ncbi:predicted protein [Histoplasma mississippiense (nom. inval.)]|uniref:predicted protein n=1 Tax=Ajellomyces capsulatus (strain NAm1 / WU24) TaxID=2059318 RepID=UPI000157B58D|nr:predicted protein [Histoplasma mississippiense (nom. inval.)]EDN02613.1 predicted protein [Histoplasma mississippiense (nom. inval.)]